MSERIYYFDHAASSWPKPPEVAKAMVEAVQAYGANPGRGGHRLSVKAGRTIMETRMNLAKLFGIRNPNDIAMTSNATIALNMAIAGCLTKGDHVIFSSIEHNSVRRPIERLKKTLGIEADMFPVSNRGKVDLEQLRKRFKTNTRLVVCSHSSNLLGAILPIAEIGAMAREHGALFLVDAAQTAGTYPIDVRTLNVDMMAFPGHKGLLGPQGTGGLYIGPNVELEPIITGGTGSQSESIEQPSVRPDKFESGTQNTPGIAGLNQGVNYVLRETVERIHEKEWNLTQRLMKGLLEIEEADILGPELGEDKTGIVSFVVQGRDPSELAFRLDREYGIAVRAGYHCTPLGHGTAGSAETGAVRASMGVYTTEEEVDYLIRSVKEIVRQS